MYQHHEKLFYPLFKDHYNKGYLSNTEYDNLNSNITKMISDINKIITDTDDNKKITFIFEADFPNRIPLEIDQYRRNYNIDSICNIRYKLDAKSTHASVTFGDGTARFIKLRIAYILNVILDIIPYATNYTVKESDFDDNVTILYKHMFSEDAWIKICKLCLVTDQVENIEKIPVVSSKLDFIFEEINKKDMA